MANGQIHENIASDVLSQFGMPLSVSAMPKLQQFPMLQELGFNGQLGHLGSSFHGLKDFNIQLDMYSSTNPILGAAWKVIRSIAPKNPSIISLLFSSPSLGQVGNLFQSIHNFGKVFGISPNPLPKVTSIAGKAAGL